MKLGKSTIKYPIKQQQHLAKQVVQNQSKSVLQADQFTAREFLQQGHEDAPIPDVLKEVMDLYGWVTLWMDKQE